MGSAVGPRERGRRAAQRKRSECSERALCCAVLSLIWLQAGGLPHSLFVAIFAEKLLEPYLEVLIYRFTRKYAPPGCNSHTLGSREDSTEVWRDNNQSSSSFALSCRRSR